MGVRSPESGVWRRMGDGGTPHSSLPTPYSPLGFFAHRAVAATEARVSSRV
jgi:hypothetical protein